MPANESDVNTGFNIEPRNNLSHVIGSNEFPLLEKTISAVLKDAVEKFGDEDAAIFCDQSIRWTYRQFDHHVDALAGGLLELGFTKGERIGVWSPNRYEWLLAQFATARLGIILVNINPAYRLFELEYALNKVGCRGLFTARKFKTSNYTGMLQSLAPELASDTPGNLNAVKLPHLKTIICMGDDIPAGMLAFDAIMESGKRVAAERLDVITATLDGNDPINIQFTSGTTGLPKGACLTHKNIVNNANFVTAAMEFSAADRLCIPVPFYHCFGMVMGTLGCVTKGAAMVVPGEGFEPVATLEAVSKEKCTALFGVPTMFVAELDLPDFASYDLSHLRTGIMAGAPCPVEVMNNVQALMNMKQVTIAYGMTETSPVSFQSNVDDPLEKRVSSVGRIHPHVEVRIIDEEGNTVGVGEQGELLTRGYSVMQSYWQDEEQTAAAIDADGWMHTGDLATLDEQGYCNITGRVKDMICRGGENIYPREIEEFLYTHASISQVQVFGIPDDKYGEITCAWIIAKGDVEVSEQEIIDFCKGQIAHFKVPVHVRFKQELPMTVTGKPQKFLMRDEMMAELGVVQKETA
ncbi:MAG: AMP-binding protein [Hyphomicrobiales bacterium]|nr:AMP-binding protein [Hyphomicrobiales bacterium]